MKFSEKNALINEFYRGKVREEKDKKAVADLLGISYFTLMGKLNVGGNFTPVQIDILKEYFNGKSKITADDNRRNTVRVSDETVSPGPEE